MKIIIHKSSRLLCLYSSDTLKFSCKIALGANPIGRKKVAGDFKTPEGEYAICLVKEKGKFGYSLGINYPNIQDAQLALLEDTIDISTYNIICDSIRSNTRPPWGSPLGGEIYLHEGSTDTDWTAGCIALSSSDMQYIYENRDFIDSICIYS